MAGDKSEKPWEYTLRKYVLLLATVVATLTYSSAFSPPGGVWQETDGEHLAGDPIIRGTHYRLYLVFFYCNATGFASSLVVIILILLLSVQHEDMSGASILTWQHALVPLRLVMTLNLLSILGAYAAATCRDAVTTTYSTVLVVGVLAYLTVQVALSSRAPAARRGGEGDQQQQIGDGDDVLGQRPRKVLMLLATFAVSVTYMSGLSTPGGFWDGSQAGHTAGDAILLDYSRARLVTFFVCNTTAFVASLLIILLLLDKKLRANAGLRSHELYGCIVVALAGLVAAYAAGSCRDAETTAYVVVLVAVVLGYMLFHAFFAVQVVDATLKSNSWKRLVTVYGAASGCLRRPIAAASSCFHFRRQAPQSHPDAENARQKAINESMDKARSLVLLLATLAASVTYQAGLVPPGDVWQDDGDGHLAGDPILLTTHPRRYKAFYYCNSTAFMASLAAIVLLQRRSALKRHTLEAAMILDLFGLMGAYAAGSCRDVSTSIYVVALAGGVMVYVVIHVIFFTLDHGERRRIAVVAGPRRQQDDDDDDEEEVSVEKRRKRLLLFAILAATITYQAGLTPPSGFWPKDDDEQGHRAGEPVLLSNYPRRYKAFFYSNSLSFMSAIAHIILLVNPNLYRPAIRSYALSVCTAVGLLGLVGAYAAGSTQHLKTSIYIFVLAFLVILLMAVLFLVAGRKKKQKKQGKATSNVVADESSAIEAGGGTGRGDPPVAGGDIAEPVVAGEAAEVDDEVIRAKEREKAKHAKCKYLMLLGILMASVTYAAGLDPPGGVWQSDGDGHAAGDPVLRTNRRLRYLFFYHCNSTSFVASVVVVVLLLPQKLVGIGWWLTVTNAAIVLNLFGLLGAHAAGSSRAWETSGYIAAMIIAALAFVFVHALTSCFDKTRGPRSSSHLPAGDVTPQSIGRRQPLEVSV